MKDIQISIIQAECSKCNKRDWVILIKTKGKDPIAICADCASKYINSLLQIGVFRKFFDFIGKRGLNERESKK